MKWINQVKPNGFFYIGILIMILNVVFLGLQLFANDDWFCACLLF